MDIAGKTDFRLLRIELDGTIFGGIVAPELAEACRMAAQHFAKVGYAPPWIGYVAFDGDECVGTCAFKTPPIDGIVELAYATIEKHQNKGYATAMAKCFRWQNGWKVFHSKHGLPRNYGRRFLVGGASNFDPAGRNWDRAMLKINTDQLAEISWTSPKGKFAAFGKEVSEALGRKPDSTDLMERHPFDVEILRVPPGKTPYPFHQHSAQWEFYHVISGSGLARDASGNTPIAPGDAFLFKPNEPHQIINSGEVDLVLFVVADNPIGESTYFPDSQKWGVKAPERRVFRGAALEYYDGEE